MYNGVMPFDAAEWSSTFYFSLYVGLQWLCWNVYISFTREQRLFCFVELLWWISCNHLLATNGETAVQTVISLYSMLLWRHTMWRRALWYHVTNTCPQMAKTTNKLNSNFTRMKFIFIISTPRRRYGGICSQLPSIGWAMAVNVL